MKLAPTRIQFREAEHHHDRLTLLAMVDNVAARLHECYDDVPGNAKGAVLELGHELSAFRQRMIDES